MKLEKVAESDEMELYKFTETNMIMAVIDKKEKTAKIVIKNTLIEEYYGIENAEDVEKITEEKKFDLTVKTGATIAMMYTEKTK